MLMLLLLLLLLPSVLPVRESSAACWSVRKSRNSSDELTSSIRVSVFKYALSADCLPRR